MIMLSVCTYFPSYIIDVYISFLILICVSYTTYYQFFILLATVGTIFMEKILLLSILLYKATAMPKLNTVTLFLVEFKILCVVVYQPPPPFNQTTNIRT